MKLKETKVYMTAQKYYHKVRNRIGKYNKLKRRYPACYREAAKAPVQENKVVFIELRLPELTNSFQTMYQELSAKYDFEIHCHFLRTTFVGKQEHERRCLDMIRDVATAKYVFLNEASNVFSSLPIREETVVTQLWHGCGAFKKFGMSTADLLFGENRKNMLKYPYNKNYTHVTVSSPEVIWAYAEAMNLDKDSGIIKPLGSSRTDVFYDDIFIRKAYNKLYRLMPEARDKKVILYAPTFRGRVAAAASPDCFDVGMFAENLSEEYVLLFKHHPLVRIRPEIPEAYADFARDFTDTMAIDELLCVADICISDYSSLVFEYSLFEKPLLFYAYDLDEYFDWRGFYYDYQELTPGPIVTTNEEMIDYIRHIDTRFEKEQVTAFKEKFMSACDGHATERILNTVMGEEVLSAHRYGYHQFQDAVKVSVIVPVYNCQDYLPQCMDSILRQSLREIEVICVDDGSKDDSPAILDYYAKRDDRVTVLHQENRYAGVARNNGLQQAHGKYVVFWDGDDFFREDALQKLYDQAEADKAEICVCGANRYDEESNKELLTSVYLKMQYIPEKRPFSHTDMPEYIFNFATNVPWNKLFLRSFIEEHGLRFQDIKQANDTCFVMQALYLAKWITVTDCKPIYYRYNNAASLTGKASDTMFCAYGAYKDVYGFLKEQADFSRVEQSFVNRVLSGLIGSLNAQRNLESYRLMYNKIKEEGLDYFDIANHSRDYFYADWQYEEMENIKTMDLEGFLYYLFKREQNNVQKRKSQTIEVKRQLRKSMEETEKQQQKLEDTLQSKTVKIAFKVKKIVTLNGLLLRKNW